MLPLQVRSAVEALLTEEFDEDVRVSDFSAVGGGCINNGGIVKTSSGDYFLKWNSADKYPGMFKAEGLGLGILRKADAIRVPSVTGTGDTDDYQFILLSYIKRAPRSHDYWTILGERIAQLHRQKAATFGLDHSNYIGSLPQYNTPSTSWIDFFIDQRLEAQLRIADNKVDAGTRRSFERLYKILPGFLATEEPSLLHGDLWSGNVLVDESGEPALIDPAVYFGHREVDLAMTQLFGGFDNDFLEGYHTAFPLQPGFKQRFELYNLYPLLVHVNLFGGGYLLQVKNVLNRFV